MNSDYYAQAAQALGMQQSAAYNQAPKPETAVEALNRQLVDINATVSGALRRVRAALDRILIPPQSTGASGGLEKLSAVPVGLPGAGQSLDTLSRALAELNDEISRLETIG